MGAFNEGSEITLNTTRPLCPHIALSAPPSPTPHGVAARPRTIMRQCNCVPAAGASAAASSAPSQKKLDDRLRQRHTV